MAARGGAVGRAGQGAAERRTVALGRVLQAAGLLAARGAGRGGVLRAAGLLAARGAGRGGVLRAAAARGTGVGRRCEPEATC